MMHINGLFGHWHAWLLFGSAWVGIAVLVGLTFGVIAKVGRGRGEK